MARKDDNLVRFPAPEAARTPGPIRDRSLLARVSQVAGMVLGILLVAALVLLLGAAGMWLAASALRMLGWVRP